MTEHLTTSNATATSDATSKPIKAWPIIERPTQVTRAQLKLMTPTAIEQARQAGALEDILAGKEAK